MSLYNWHEFQLQAATGTSWPNNDVFKDFEEKVTTWAQNHNHGQSSVFGRIDTAARYVC